ncbi:MAG: autotransporter outer membrane beta-barrel domain-containing protein [Puniceicoccales bacterium]|jgi:outer membrane autotransporter protein|nr:autotransporter outer membrane beta-barrel domain-containing protein [Puniceicoccales bacterium]
MSHPIFRHILSASALAFAATAPLLARPHNGLGEFLDFVGHDFPDWAATNASALPFGAMGNLPALTSAGEIGGILRQIDQPYAVPDSANVTRRDVDAFYGDATLSQDGRHPAHRGAWETFAFGQWNTGDFDNAPNRPVYNPETWGGLVGVQRWVDDERLVGLTASYHFARADFHNNTPAGIVGVNDGGRIDGDQARLRLYAALVPEGQPWWLTFGASGGYVGYETKRNSPLDAAGVTATATPEGYEVGLFAALGARLHIVDSLALTPLARVDYNNTSIGKFTEHGSNYGFRVSRFNAESFQTRLGAGLEYTGEFSFGFLYARCSTVWASELGGDDIKITSRLYGYRHHVFAGQLFGDAVEVAPSLTLVLNNGLVLQAAYQVQITFDSQFSQNVTLGLGWRF